MIESIKDQGENLSQASREFAVDRKTLRTWMGNYENMKAIVKKRSRRRLDGGGRPSKLPELELELFRWFKRQREERMIVTYRRIREKAIQLRCDMGLDDDETILFSSKWIYNFCQRHDIRLVCHFP